MKYSLISEISIIFVKLMKLSVILLFFTFHRLYSLRTLKDEFPNTLRIQFPSLFSSTLPPFSPYFSCQLHQSLILTLSLCFIIQSFWLLILQSFSPNQLFHVLLVTIFSWQKLQNQIVFKLSRIIPLIESLIGCKCHFMLIPDPHQ